MTNDDTIYNTNLQIPADRQSARICRWRSAASVVYYNYPMVTEPLDQARDGGGVDLEPTPDEQAAFSQLFTKYFAPVYRYVHGRVPMAEEAKDIVHMVFYRIWTRRPQLDPNRSLLPFLCTLARYATVDYLRHERVEHRFARHCLQLIALDGPPAAADDAEQEVLRQERAAIVTQALDSLSPRQREVMALRWREQLSYDEIARRLNISRKTVAMHLARAMEHLRERLPDMYDIE
jgi:RNA polymerase sigma-70 factor (ECF subfamily)